MNRPCGYIAAMKIGRTPRVGVFHRPADGFTLIELTIVIVLISLFAGLTIPMLTGFGENKLDASARRLAGTVKYLFNEAALAKMPYRLLVNLDEGTYRAQRLEGVEWKEVEGTGRRQRLKGEVRFKAVGIPGRETYTSGEPAIEIREIGWMEETIIHLEESGKELTLRIKPFTGTTEVFEGYREFEEQR